MDTRNMSIGERIRQLREDKDMSQTDLGLAVGRDYRSIQRIEKGSSLSANELSIFAKALDTDEVYLISGVKAEYFSDFNEYGLSGEALETLKAHKEIVDETCREFGINYDLEDISIDPYIFALETLILHPKLANLIGTYLSDDMEYITAMEYATSEGTAEFDRVTIQAKDVFDFKADSFESIYRLNIMDELLKLRKELEPVRSALREERWRRMDLQPLEEIKDNANKSFDKLSRAKERKEIK